MFDFIKTQHRKRHLARHPIPDAIWRQVIQLPLFMGLSGEERQRLREQAAWFLHKKSIVCVDGLELSDADRVMLAAQAVLPILNLGFDAYDDWHEVIVYPGQFLSRDRYTDHFGLVHEYEQILAGQARSDGPVLLSWLDVSQSAWLDGWNVVIHEFAHKLDMRDGAPNGRPPLHAGMNAAQWKAVFSRAFSNLSRLAHTGEYSPIDLYAAENPAECFAVLSEYFFETPHAIAEHYPEVYQQLRQFYQQDPLSRLPRVRYRPAFEPLDLGPVAFDPLMNPGILPTPAPGGWA
ncbi:M90 family metallopeptidase [Amantichitinum ursilacus]|uniref:Protein MtfA n=1 Tax=Amantichitinum ursilacus TaxID=857265 RepID=A0A0N0XJ67_9NEIS|nr:M90 family metallopeptidase [Amantichitinum ursilacus]KPC50823.1 Protein MtfA [Amantichitinum ursilacus]